MKSLLVLLLLTICFPVFADELSLIDHKQLNKAIDTSVEPAEENEEEKVDLTKDKVSNMELEDPFIEDEAKKIREIKLLSLDVQKTDLELKRQQMLVKMQKINNQTESHIVHEQGNMQKMINVVVKSILIAGTKKLAVMGVNNKYFTVSEQQHFSEGLVIKAIEADKVQVQYLDGRVEDIYYTKG